MAELVGRNLGLHEIGYATGASGKVQNPKMLPKFAGMCTTKQDMADRLCL